ncbi:uncharacterized protein BJ212DRAFT_1304685 [Suillus subaureus]|uniref:Uncharacterized protein n=1 Tax=Suillus subaureus TaxID=48587 RepID=A0A9P7DTY2_9AGAM|nr:uncharacterized protein BJ212DRAFT_1304685 [Suillus subaureus]KAG1803121.1 hypothetical protein BJ212DRAFT_1304685 [Suillus subaureus]
MTKPSTSCKVGPPRKATPPHKVSPAHAVKMNHKFGKSKLPDTLPIANGSVGDGSPEPSPTNKDSGALAIVLISQYSSRSASYVSTAKYLLQRVKLMNIQVRPLLRAATMNRPDQEVDEDCVSPAPPAQRAKGKGRELPFPADDEDLHDEAIDKAVTLGDKTVAEVEKIAKEYGKSTRMILIQAGLAMKYPKSSDMSTNDWKQMQCIHWLKDSNQCENPKLWKEVCKFWDGSSRTTEESSKALYNHVMAVHDAFGLSCQAYLHLEDIYVGGFVLYTGVFTGSPLILDLVNKKQADIRELIDYLTTVIKYNCIDDTASLPSFTCFMALKFNPELSSPIMMLEKFATEGVGILYEAKNIPWKTMLNSLYLHQAQVADWPAGVPPVGSDFVFKDLKTDKLKALVGPYLKHCMGSDYNVELAHVKHLELKKTRKDKLSGVKVPEQELMFIPWSDESKDLMSNKDSDMLNIPLITNTDGKVQCTLMDCILFMKNLPPNIEVPDPAASPHNSLTPQPSSLLAWSPSPPHRDHCKVLPLPHSKVTPH